MGRWVSSLACSHPWCASPFSIKSTVTDHHPFSKFTKLFNNIIFRSRFVTHTRARTPRQNKDDSTFEQGSNKTVIVIKNKNAISGCHGNQHSRTPGNVVKHATEHAAAKQVKRLFIRLQHVVQCPLVRAQETQAGPSPRRRTGASEPRAHQPGSGMNGTKWSMPRQWVQLSADPRGGDTRTCAHASSNLCSRSQQHRGEQTEVPRAAGDVPVAGRC